MNDLDPKLLKIIALARDGVGGERSAAIKKVRQTCEREGLCFEDVMRTTDKKEFTLSIKYRNKAEKDIIAQVCYKFALFDGGDLYCDYRKRFIYETTAACHIETVYAAKVYLAAYRKEKRRMIKDLLGAFLYKHNLFRTSDETASANEPDYDVMHRQLNLTRNMEDVTIRKAIKG